MKINKLKSALSNYPTGIVCVFAKTKNGYNAIIVNSFTSVSLNPPIVAWCLDKKSSKFNAFKNSKVRPLLFYVIIKKNLLIKLLFIKTK